MTDVRHGTNGGRDAEMRVCSTDGTEGGKTGGMQDRRKQDRRKQDRREAGQKGSRTGGIQDSVGSVKRE